MLYRKVVEVESLKNCLTPGDWTVCSLKFVARKVFADRDFLPHGLGSVCAVRCICTSKEHKLCIRTIHNGRGCVIVRRIT